MHFFFPNLALGTIFGRHLKFWLPHIDSGLYDIEADMCIVDNKVLFDYVGFPALETTFTAFKKLSECQSSQEMVKSADEEKSQCASDSPGMCCCVAVESLEQISSSTLFISLLESHAKSFCVTVKAVSTAGNPT